jgi:transposase
MRWLATSSGELWEAIEPCLPRPRRWGGTPRVPDRAALAGIVYVLRQGLRWRDLPRELGCGSGVTCWRRLRRWQALGVWAAVHRTLLNWLGLLEAIRREWARLDSASVRAKRGGEATGPNPTAASAARSTTVRMGVPGTAGMTRSTTGPPR